MPVFYSPVPQTLRAGLSSVGSSVFNNRTADGDAAPEPDERSVANELVSHLPLQMLLYFNMFYFPCWWVSTVSMLHVKFCVLPGYYQALLVSGVVLLSATEVTRLYLGYVGNLTEKVPELAAFCLLSVAPQLPVLLFLLTDEATLILPLERAVHGLSLLLLLAQLACAVLALRTVTRKLTLVFHLQQIGEMESFHHQHHQHHLQHHHHQQHRHPADMLSPLCSLPQHHHRSVLPAENHQEFH